LHNNSIAAAAAVPSLDEKRQRWWRKCNFTVCSSKLS